MAENVPDDPTPGGADSEREHPLFSASDARPANSLAAMAERRVAEARQDGLFDNLALHGKPIPDLDRRRPPGWWAASFVRRERHQMQRSDLEQKVRATKPAMWRCSCEDDLLAAVKALNDEITAFNERATVERMPLLDRSETLATWRRLRSGPT